MRQTDDSTGLSPSDALKRFAQRLPDTIKDSVLVRCIGPFGRFEFNPEQDLFAAFCSILDSAELRYLAAECAKVIGVMELALQHSRGDEQFYREVAEATGVKALEEIALRAPLRDRHFEAALAEFLQICSTVLSAKALYIWQLLLEAEDREEQDDE